MSERDFDNLLRFKRIERGFKRTGLVIVLLILFLLLILTGCGDTSIHSEGMVVREETATEPVSVKDNSDSKEGDIPKVSETPKGETEIHTKTDRELIAESATLVASELIDAIQRNNERKKAERATRKKIYAYRYGISKPREEMIEKYKELRNKNMHHDVYAFKDGRKRYFLIHFANDDAETIYAGLDSINRSIRETIRDRVEVVDLKSDDFCGNGSLREGEVIKVKREDFVIPVLECGD